MHLHTYADICKHGKPLNSWQYNTVYYNTTYYAQIKRIIVKHKVKRFLTETKKLNIADKMLINTVNDFMSMDKCVLSRR